MSFTILQIGAFPFPTRHGSQVYVRGMSRALARRGHHVLLACYAGGEGPVPPEIDVVRVPRVPGARFTGSGPHWSKLPSDVQLVRTIRRVVQRRRVHLLHAHNVEGPVLAWLGRGRGGPPLVHNQHTEMAEELPCWFPVPGASLAGRLVDRVPPLLADANIALSERAAERLQRAGARRVVHLPPGVDLDELRGGDPARARQRWDLQGDWVVYAGNTDAYQDLPVLLRAMARVRAGLLVVTGDPLEPLHRAAAEAGLPEDRRRFVRSGDFADTRDALAAAALAAVPRTRCAGFPIKLLNQLGLGVPTVAARGSAREIPGVIPVADGDHEAMAGAIAGLIADPVRRRTLADRARAAIAADWTWDARAVRLEAVYAELLDR